jgi:uncharacterized phage protein gp47/JayE
MDITQDFDELLSGLLRDHTNQDSSADVSVGSIIYMKCVALASVGWGVLKYGNWVLRQIFPDSANSENLEHAAWIRGMSRLIGETDEAYLARLLTRMRRPPAGGNKTDYEVWAKDVVRTAPSIYLPLADEIVAGDLPSFSATVAVDLSTAYPAWDHDGAAEGQFVKVSYGPAEGCDYTKVRLYADVSGSDAVYNIQYSDDGTTWVDTDNTITPALAGWNEATWTSVGFRRYWRLVLDAAPTDESQIMEMEWYTGTGESAAQATCYPAAQGAGTVDVLVVSNQGDGTPTQALLDAIVASIELLQPADSNPDGLRVIGPSITPVDVAIGYTGVVDEDAVQSDVEAYIRSIAPGGTLYRSRIVSIVVANGADDAVVSTPVADYTCGAYEVVSPRVTFP